MSDFKVDNLDTAEWALNKIAEAEATMADNKKHADAQREKISVWEEEVNRKSVDTVSFMAAHLQLFLEGEGKKSIKCINGNIGFRKRQPKWTIKNTDALISELELKGYDHLIRVKKEPNLMDMKKDFSTINGQAIDSTTGEILDGVEIEAQADSFNFKTN